MFSQVLLVSKINYVCVCIFPLVAVERNNLMRLSQSIPFTPVPPRGRCIPRHVSSGENGADGPAEQRQAVEE